ncbi:MAG: LptA/OstA family protein [Kiritimatiellae bacterium]|nr:LptA/OstA family protein [Kiritimatiellia bacterium]
MKIRSLLVPVLCALAMPMMLSAQGIADLGNPDDIMLRKPAVQMPAVQKPAVQMPVVQKPVVQKPAVPAVDAAAAQKARENAEELKRLREQVAAEKKAREDAAARAQAAEAAARAAQEQAQAAAEQAKAAEEAKAAAEQARVAAEAAQAKKPKLEAPVQTVPPEVAQKGTVPQAGKKPKKQLSGRPAVITADRTDYDRKEGVILFDRNVYVDDEQYQMHADRLFVFLDGTNDLKRLVALGNVSITNDAKSAACAKAVYNRSAQRITMFSDGSDDGVAWLRDAGSKAGDASEIQGERITYWLDSGLASVDKIKVKLPGIKGSSNPKDIFNPKAAGKKDKKAADEKDK